MSNKVQDTLSKLDTILGKNKKKKTDYKELNELRKKSFLKLKPGKNQVVFVKPQGAEDPFFVWGYHNSLQEVAYYSVPCNQFNRNEDCIICNVISQLQKEDYEGNKHLWYPIRQQTEIYAPVVNVESEATQTEGLKWLRMSKTIVSQLTEWLRNLEPGEESFYSDAEPEKVIINYNKDELPLNQYKLDKKSMKAFHSQQLVDWRGTLRPVAEFIIPKGQEELKKMVDEYFGRISAEINSDTATAGDDPAELAAAEAKLVELKSKK